MPDLEQLKAELTEALVLTLHNTWSKVQHTRASDVDRDCWDDAEGFMDDLFPLVAAALSSVRLQGVRSAIDEILYRLDQRIDWAYGQTTRSGLAAARDVVWNYGTEPARGSRVVQPAPEPDDVFELPRRNEQRHTGHINQGWPDHESAKAGHSTPMSVPATEEGETT